MQMKRLNAGRGAVPAFRLRPRGGLIRGLCTRTGTRLGSPPVGVGTSRSGVDERRQRAIVFGAVLGIRPAALGGRRRGAVAQAIVVAPGASLFLGLRDGVAWFAAHARHHALDAPGWRDLRRAAATWPAFESGVFAMARALLHWQSSTRFCSACGGDITFRRAGYTAHCAQCGKDHYPRVDPAVIVAVSDGERLLLGRQASWPARRYSVVAGFVEPGETLEQTVAREVLEETARRFEDEDLKVTAASGEALFLAGELVGGASSFAVIKPPIAAALKAKVHCGPKG